MFADRIKNIDKAIKGLEKEVLRSLKRHDNLVVDYITDVQLFENGEDGQGRRLRSGITGKENYSITTVEQKKAKGQRFDHFTLKDEGDFYASYKLTANGLVIADTQKDDQDLVETFGFDILVLSDKGQDVMIDEFLRDDLRGYFRKQIC